MTPASEYTDRQVELLARAILERERRAMQPSAPRRRRRKKAMTAETTMPAADQATGIPTRKGDIKMTRNQKKKQETFVTPVGEAVYPWLNIPDTKYDNAGVYRCGLRLRGGDAQTMLAAVDAAMEASLEEAAKDGYGDPEPAKPPYKLEDDGSFTFSFKSKASGLDAAGKPWTRKVRVVDSQNTAIPPDVRIGNGSRVRLEYSIGNWHTAKNGAGVSLRLVAAQVLELREPSRLKFEAAEEGYVVAGTTEGGAR